MGSRVDNRWALWGVLTAAVSGPAAAQLHLPAGTQAVPVLVNERRLESDAVMFTRTGRTLLPMRALFTSLGARVEWDPRERAVYAWKPDGTGVRFGVGEHRVQSLRMAQDPFPGSWGQVISSHPLDTPAQVLGSRVYVPVRAASEALAADVRWTSIPPLVRVRTELVADAPPVEYRDVDRDPRFSGREREERLARELGEERMARERLERERLERDQLERDRLELERERLERDRLERERFERERFDRERFDRERREEPEDPDPILRDARPVPGDAVTRPGAVARSLRVNLSLPEAQNRGEVPMRLVVQNTGPRPVVLNFNSAQQFDFEVIQNGVVVWNWARDRAFSQVPTMVTLKPGERIAFQTVWNQVTNNGRVARRGDYTIRGYLNTVADQLRLESRQELELRR